MHIKQQHVTLKTSSKLLVGTLMSVLVLISGAQVHADTTTQTTKQTTSVINNKINATSTKVTPTQATTNSATAKQAPAKANPNSSSMPSTNSKPTKATDKQVATTHSTFIKQTAPKTVKPSTPKVTANKTTKPVASKTTTQGAAVKQTSPKVSSSVKKAVTKQQSSHPTEKTIKNGWVGNRYYKNNKAVTGKQKINNNWYFFNENGVATKGFQIKGNKRSYYDKNYVQLRNRYKKINNDTYYFDNNGYAVTGLRRNGKTIQYFDKSFRQVRNNYYQKNGKNIYYFNKNGNAIKGLRKINANYVEYYDKNFKQVRNKVVKINKNTVYFMENNGFARRGRNGKPTNIKNVKNAGTAGFYNGGYSYPPYQCTAFVAGILASQGINGSKFTYLGNGAQWATSARNRGIKVDRKPTVGAVVSFAGGSYSYYGHVAYIKGINADGSFVIAEGNNAGRAYTERTIYMNYEIAGIIHF